MLLALGGVLATSLAGGGLTYALFGASADPAETEVKAGTVELYGYRDQSDTIDGPMFYITAAGDGMSTKGVPGRYPSGYWAPGDTVKRVLALRNTGSLDAKLKTLSASISGDEALARALDVKICSTTTCSAAVYFSGTLWDLAQNPQPLSGPVEMTKNGPTKLLHFVVTLPTSAGNELQGKSVEADFTVYAEQLRNNP